MIVKKKIEERKKEKIRKKRRFFFLLLFSFFQNIAMSSKIVSVFGQHGEALSLSIFKSGDGNENKLTNDEYMSLLDLLRQQDKAVLSGALSETLCVLAPYVLPSCLQNCLVLTKDLMTARKVFRAFAGYDMFEHEEYKIERRWHAVLVKKALARDNTDDDVFPSVSYCLSANMPDDDDVVVVNMQDYNPSRAFLDFYPERFDLVIIYDREKFSKNFLSMLEGKVGNSKCKVLYLTA